MSFGVLGRRRCSHDSNAAVITVNALAFCVLLWYVFWSWCSDEAVTYVTIIMYSAAELKEVLRLSSV